MWEVMDPGTLLDEDIRVRVKVVVTDGERSQVEDLPVRPKTPHEAFDSPTSRRHLELTLRPYRWVVISGEVRPPSVLTLLFPVPVSHPITSDQEEHSTIRP